MNNVLLLREMHFKYIKYIIFNLSIHKGSGKAGRAQDTRYNERLKAEEELKVSISFLDLPY